nr:MAG TPA: hypothetical protein [Bacteriophage sp.]
MNSWSFKNLLQFATTVVIFKNLTTYEAITMKL